MAQITIRLKEIVGRIIKFFTIILCTSLAKYSVTKSKTIGRFCFEGRGGGDEEWGREGC